MVPVHSKLEADPVRISEAITSRTILVAASAPCFPYGVVDPVEEISRICLEKKVLFHVDACMGGFMLPFLEELGYQVPLFDFRLKGVTSISLDAHKYGYAPKGSSVILYRIRSLRRKQFFVHPDWPGCIIRDQCINQKKGKKYQADRKSPGRDVRCLIAFRFQQQQCIFKVTWCHKGCFSLIRVASGWN